MATSKLKIGELDLSEPRAIKGMMGKDARTGTLWVAIQLDDEKEPERPKAKRRTKHEA